MPDIEFNTTAGQTIARELMILYLNTGTSEAPVWSAVGSRVGESDVEYDWGQESSQDILGKTNTSMKKPVITQSFDPLPLDAGDAAAVMLWNIAVKDQDAQMERELNSLKKKIQSLNDKIYMKQQEKLPLVSQFEKLSEELDGAKWKLANLKSAGAGKTEIADQAERVKLLQGEYNKVYSSLERIDASIRSANLELEMAEGKDLLRKVK